MTTSSAVVFTWLHLTGLHVGKQGFKDVWPNYRDQLQLDLEFLYKKVGPLDMVLFTGDFTQSGQPDEYDEVTRLLVELWEFFDQLKYKPKLLAVPGNHDLDRSKDKEGSALLTLERMWEEVQKEFWDNASTPERMLIRRVFANYYKWWDTLPIRMKPEIYSPGILAGVFSATLDKNELKLGIAGLNSTFLHLVDGDLKGKLALHSRQFHSACGGDGPKWVKEHDVCLLLTHQPPDWLTENAQVQLNQFIHHPPHRFTLHLFGHLHDPNQPGLIADGVNNRRRLQGYSLIVMDEQGDNRILRPDGYSVCQLKIYPNSAELRIWPRRAVKIRNGGWVLDRDYSFPLDRDDDGMQPLPVKLLRERHLPDRDDDGMQLVPGNQRDTTLEEVRQPLINAPMQVPAGGREVEMIESDEAKIPASGRVKAQEGAFMAHPFFDASAYPWHRPEAVRFQEALTNAVPVVARIDLIYRQCGNRLPALVLNNPPDLIWKEALQNLTSQGALRKLCDVVLGMDSLKNIHKVVGEIVN